MDVLKEIKEAVIAIEPDAEVYLFGSRARGDNSEESDWDVLVLVPDRFDYRIKNRILDELYDIEIKHSILLGVIFRKTSSWRNDKVFHVTPFYQSVVKEYVRI